MVIHEFGNSNNPIILLLPGTCCYWKANFKNVLNQLQEYFYVGIVAYSGFEDTEQSEFISMDDEVVKLEKHIQSHYGGKVYALYGCSLGGSFVSLLAARQKIQMKYGIIGSSDMDQSGNISASIKAALVGKVIYPFIHSGKYKNRFLQKRMERRLSEPDPYYKAFVSLVGVVKYDMRFISKSSVKNQFYSDLLTRLPEKINPPQTEIHVLYARKMGVKYLERYKRYFANPVIHTFSLRHEELLGVYPEQWIQLIKEICLVVQ